MTFFQRLALWLQSYLWLIPSLFSGFFLYRLCRPFVSCRAGRWPRVLLLLTFGGSSGMVIWVGDNNLLFTLPVFFLLCLLCTRGDRLGRLAVAVIFFCLIMSVCALLDTYLQRLHQYDYMTRLARPAIFGGLYLLFRRRLPGEPVQLSLRLWKLVLALSAMPLCALAAVVLLTYQHQDSPVLHSVAMNQGMVVLPFVFLTSLVLLSAILILADHEALERAQQLAQAREVYYRGLRREQAQVRTLRHDLRNHLTVVRGLLEQGETARAIGYLSEIAGSPALQGTRRLCENEAANVVLTSKAEAMRSQGLEGDFSVALPPDLPVADADLCALLGNALDNAMEAAAQAEDKRVAVRARADKGLLMLRVENAVAGPLQPDLATTKADKAAHGFGLAGMREIAERYGGTLETAAANGRFELVACLPLRPAPADAE